MFGLQIAIVLLFFLPFCFFTVLLSFIVSEFVEILSEQAGAGGAVWFKKNQNLMTSSQPFWIQPPCLPS